VTGNDCSSVSKVKLHTCLFHSFTESVRATHFYCAQ